MSGIAEAEAWAEDKMDRKGVAKFLTAHLDAYSEIKVLNINSPWGSGKTFFLKNWQLDFKGERAYVYFNAWERDFTGDAFVSLVAAIREQLGEQIGFSVKAEGVVKKFTRKASRTLIAATPVIVKGVVKVFTGSDLSELAEVVGEDALSDAAEKAVEKLIESNKDSIGIVDDFKSVFVELVSLAAHTVAAGEDPKPVYIFIDELDRCRPTYAIELLERIKHLFDCGSCKFIVATDTLQLSHSVKAIYGEGFDGGRYLKRFFDAEFKLDNTDISHWISSRVATEKFSSRRSLTIPTAIDWAYVSRSSKAKHPSQDAVLPDSNITSEVQIVFLALAKTFGTQFRELEKILLQVFSVKANLNSEDFDFFWAAYLIFLKDADVALYSEVINGNFESAIENVTLKYRGRNFYYEDFEVSIHSVFRVYAKLFRGGERLAKIVGTDSLSRDNKYVVSIRQGFDCNYKELSSYPKLVDLAYKLE